MENFAVLSGYVTNDPETKVAPNGKTVINFTLSVYARFKKDGDKKHVSFFDIVYWPIDKIEGNVQREVAKLEKGALVTFKAEPIQERWETDGQKKSRVKFVVDGFVDVMKHHTSKPAESETSDSQPDFDDDCPF